MRPAGIYPMLYSFFDRDGGLDRAAFRRQVEVCIDSGAHGIAILGLITEVSALTPAERTTLVEWAVEDIAGRVPLMATIVATTAPEAVDLARAAESIGATYLVLQPPLGQKPPGPELSAFYASVMREVRCPVGIQNAPEFLGVGLTVAEIRDLRRRHDNFTLMKGEGPLVAVKPYIDALGSDFDIFNGRGGLELPDNLLAGCAGMIPAPDCADVQIDIYEAVRSGDLGRAAALYETILPYIVFAMQSLDVAILYGKRMFARRAGIDNDCRCRVPGLTPTPFFDAALTRWSSRFAEYGSRPHPRPRGEGSAASA
jgi:dihydrodipicolinate synthase/N-acetylneuraminate lyase